MSARRVVVEFLGEDKSLGKTMGDVGGKSSALTTKLGGVAKVAGAALAGGAVIAGGALFKMGQKAGDLNETISKTEQIFGRSAGGLQKWAASGDQAFGMSKQTALDAAATFGVFGKSAGKTGQELAKFSQQNTELAADLASFHNTTPEEAIEALGAAFRGETEPMRRYGVLLDDASMRAEALKMGLVSTTKEALTPQQKVLAAQALIMKQTSDAQGDFERTSGGLANQQRILKAEFENMQTSIGQKVLPIMLTLATFANGTLIPALGQVGTWVSANVLPALQQLGQEVAARVVPAAQQMAMWLGTYLVPALQQIGTWIAGTVLPALGSFAGTLNSNRDIVLAVAAGLAVAKVGLVAYATYTKVAAAATVAWTTVQKVLNGTLKANPVGIVITALGLLAAGLVVAYERSSTFRGIVDKVADVLRGTVLPVVAKMVSVVGGALVGAVQAGISILGQIIGKAAAVGKAFVDAVQDVAKFVTGVQEKIGKALEFVGGIPGKAAAALGNIGGTLLEAGRSLIQGLIDGITAKVGELKSKLSSITKLIPDWKGPLDKDKVLLTPAGEALIEGLIKGIEKKKTKLQTVLEKITDHIKKKQDALAALLDRRQSIVDSFRGFGSSVFGMDGGEGGPTAQGMVDFSAGQRAKAEQLNTDVATLIGKGLSEDLIQQMIDQGQGGVDQIHALASATNEQIQAINANNAATVAALEAAGLRAANAVVGEQIAQAQRDVKLADTIRDKLAELLDQQDKNTVIQIQLGGKVIHASLLRLKRESGRKLELD